MKSIRILLFLFLVPVIAFTQPGQNPVSIASVNKQFQAGKAVNFTENKGQMADIQGHAVNSLLFKTSSGGADVYITTNGISYVFIKPKKIIRSHDKFHDANETDSIQYCRADMELEGATINKENISNELVNADYHNYFLSQCPSGIMNVHSYEKITIKNIYPGIDWVLYVKDKTGLKYDFIVHPNADPSIIKLKYKWTDAPELQKNGSLKISTPLGNIVEGSPISYEHENRTKTIKTEYALQNNEISFKVGDYDKGNTLVIDPTLKWATYYGGDYEEVANSISADSLNVWVAGYTSSTNFPILNPSGGVYFQGTIAGKYNAFILQFNKKGVLEWATYYGGSKEDKAFAINSDGKNAWVTGVASSTDFPLLDPGGGAYFQSTLAGNENAFVLQFSTTGILKWATYYGGNSNDCGQSISSDGKNVWVTGFTSSTNFPLLNSGSGAYYQGTNADSNDIFVLQFSTSGARKWATYYGGGGDDKAYSISSDGTNAWLTGYTRSSDFPTLNPGGSAYFQGALKGAQNAFITEFSSQGILKWATYYGGSAIDNGYSIQSDGTFVWITGATTSLDFPVLNPGKGAYFQPTDGQWSDVFILKFTVTNICKWATYYGGWGEDYGYSINSDGTNVWLTGATYTQNGYLNYTPLFPLFNPGGGAYFEASTGSINVPPNGVFLLEFDTSGVRKWATYYCGYGWGEGNSIQSDGLNVWVTGGTDGANESFPVLNPGGGAYFQDTIDYDLSHQHSYTSFILQFTACNRLDVTLSPADTNLCVGDSVKLTASGGISYVWSPSTGLSTTTGDSTIASPTTNTNYIVNYVSGKCKSTDTIPVIIYPKPIPTITPNQSICKGNKLDLNATGGIRYFWNPPTGLNNDTIADPVSNPASTIAYTVTISNQACSVKDSVSITVNPIPVITVCCNASISGGQSVAISATPVVNGYTYLWQPETGLSCATCANTMASPYTTTTYSVLVTDSLGCDTTGSVTIDVNCDAFVPEAFSPNGDGQNDLLYVRGDCIKTIDFMVFDRWGNKIFETTDKAMGWNGNYKGEAMNTGTYVYYLTATKYDGSSIDKKGNVTLVR